MSWEIVAFVLSLAAAALAAWVARRRGRHLRQLREALGEGHDEGLTAGLRALVEGRDAALREARRRQEELTQLADVLGVGVIRVDEARRVVFANQAARVLLARHERLTGRTAMEVFADHRLEAIIDRAGAQGADSEELTLREGSRPTLVVRGHRAPGDGVWLILEDVSELRRLQRIRTEFIDNLSHELRTPLTTVRLLTETLSRDLEGLEVPPRVRDRVAKIDVETGHLVQMVTELLDLSRIEQGTAPLAIEPVEVGAVVRGSLERLRPFAERQGVSLEEDVAPDLPPLPGDEERLGQLLLNLLHNAVKFSSPGDVVTVAARLGEGEVLVSVVDHGPGIPEQERDRIFERFYKVDKARVRGKGGTGLGLAIARHIVEGHGGRIWVESTEGHGSTFSFALPLASPGADGAGGVAAVPEAAARPGAA